MMPRIAEAYMKFYKIPGLWRTGICPHGASAKRILLFGLCSLYFLIDFNDSASFLLVLGVNRTFLTHEGAEQHG
jgi:hypothetical protein